MAPIHSPLRETGIARERRASSSFAGSALPVKLAWRAVAPTGGHTVLLLGQLLPKRALAALMQEDLASPDIASHFSAATW